MGQALAITQTVTPRIVAPGTVTVTTALTTQILAEVIDTLTSTASPAMSQQSLPTLTSGDVVGATATQSVGAANVLRAPPAAGIITDRWQPQSESALSPASTDAESITGPDVSLLTALGTDLVRYEEDDAGWTFAGTWTNFNTSRASSGSYVRADNAGDTASYTFTGSWVGLGFLGTRFSGEAEVFIDGASQGVVDLYRREDTPLSVYYDNLIDAGHTISVTVLGTSNPYASDTHINLDYVDTWNGVALANGTFEQGDARVLLSGGWSQVTNAGASGGAYVEAALHGQPTFWFPFTGDSVTYQALDYSGSDEVAIYIDEVFQGYFDIRTGTAPTITHSFDSLGAGLHILMVRDYRDEPTLDAFVTPAVGSPAPPPTPTIFTRHEEDDIAITYNGLPYATTASTWNRTDNNDRTSGGQFIVSNAPGDWVSFNFTGTWVAAGFVTGRQSGPAIVDVDGDGTPEVAITHDEFHTVLDRDGNIVWSTQLDPGAPGGVSAADVDGDGEVEIVTGIRYDDGTGVGRLYALNADGSILWERPAYDATSANSQSVLDLDGDGVYEIAWNGAQYGFTIFNGADGAILFNEPLTESLTGTDYPIFADVDTDGYAEIVVPSNDGIVVFGQDEVWGEARPLWNQHSYHVTNVNDDLSTPANEPNSWAIHNTYRTQTPLTDPMPVYGVTLTYTVGITDVTVITETASVTPTVITATDAYRWSYRQEWCQPVVTRTVQSRLIDVQPGEVRQVSQGTDVEYTLATGVNRLTLPPMYVSAPHIISISPTTRTVGAGATAVYTLTLSNPGLTSDVYTLSLAGLPAEWVTHASTMTVGADQTARLTETVTMTATFSDAGDADMHVAAINWGDGAVVSGTVNPNAGTVVGTHTYGASGTYTVTVTVTDDDGDAGSDTMRVSVGTSPALRETYLPLIASGSRTRLMYLPLTTK